MIPEDSRDEVWQLVRDVEQATLGRREFLIRAGKLGVSAAAASSFLATAAPAFASRDALPAGVSNLVFTGKPAKESTYKGTNQGGLVGHMTTGQFPKQPVPWLGIKAKKDYKIGYSIFDSAYPLPVAYAERGRIDGKFMGVEVLKYDNAGDPAKSLQNAELMIQQGVDFGVHLVLFPDVCERIAQLFDQHKIPQLFYAVAPSKTEKPFLVLPDYGTGVQIGKYLGGYAKQNWGGNVGAIILMGQKETGATSDFRMGGGLRGIESVLGVQPSSKIVRLDGGGGTNQESQTAMAAWLTANPSVKNILIVGFADTLAVGCVRALEAAGRDKTAAAGGQPGTPDGIAELKKGPGKSAFKVSLVQDLAFGSWPVALGVYALEGGSLPDVCAFSAQPYTAQNVNQLPPQTNTGYKPHLPS